MWIDIIKLPLMNAIAKRLITAFSTIPSLEAWLYSTALLLVLAVISLPSGFQLNFIQIDIFKASWVKVASIIVGAFLIPGVSEEVIFRVLLLPHPTENASLAARWLWGCISLVVFIAYHPLEALTIFPSGRTTFMNPVFLFLAALLGVACTLAYLQSGSLWPPVVIHWLFVVVWLLLLGGYKRLHS